MNAAASALENQIWQKHKIGDFIASILQVQTRWDCLKQLMAISDKAYALVLDYFVNDSPGVLKSLQWFLNNLNLSVKEAEYLKL